MNGFKQFLHRGSNETLVVSIVKISTFRPRTIKQVTVDLAPNMASDTIKHVFPFCVIPGYSGLTGQICIFLAPFKDKKRDILEFQDTWRPVKE